MELNCTYFTMTHVACSDCRRKINSNSISIKKVLPKETMPSSEIVSTLLIHKRCCFCNVPPKVARIVSYVLKHPINDTDVEDCILCKPFVYPKFCTAARWMRSDETLDAALWI